MPKISVIITTYNRPQFLPLAIESVLNQSYQDFEIIVINDAGENVQQIIDDFNDTRIKYFVHKMNKGLGAARNTGLSYAKGKYINFLDDDDSFYQYHLQTLIEYLEKNNYEIAYTDAVCEVSEKENGKYIVKHRVIPYSIDYESDMLLYQNITPVLCVMFKYDDTIKNIKLDENARVYEDWLYWLELTKHYDMHHLAIPTCKYTFRTDGSTMSSSRNEFTTMLPGIYSETWKRAKNQVNVCTAMNEILQKRGLQPMFRIETS